MIAIVYPQFYGVGGIARYLDSFLANLPANHAPIYLITGDEHQVARNYPGVEIIHIPFSSNRFNLFIWGIKARRCLIDLYQQDKIKWVNFHFPPLIPGLFLPRNIPVLLTAHTTYLGMSGRFYPTQFFESQWSKLSLMVKMWMERRIFALATRVLVLTEQGRQEVVSYGFKRPIAVIPNGADVKLFTPDAQVKKDIDVLFCGRIESRKGSRAMVEVCRLLLAKDPGLRICIVGYGDDDVWVNSALSAYAGQVELTGKVPFSDMILYYQRSKVYASTSFYEGLPGTCLEAMAMQLPVVVWDFLFYRDLVREGETGMLVAPNVFSDMVDKIIALVANPDKAFEMGTNGRQLLENHYAWNKLSDQILQQFKS
ncbi:MAG: glycosyltransferase family 4 protein [Methylococcaceae bacterium]|jgi:glycosyltransferase involved in cell wall biosynthesis